VVVVMVVAAPVSGIIVTPNSLVQLNVILTTEFLPTEAGKDSF
jgi:hypothetical protein